MRLNGGLGDIVPGQKNIQVLGGEQTSNMLSGTRHHNNRFAWIVVRKYMNSTQFLSYLIDSTGLHLTPVVSTSLFMTLNPSFENEPSFIRISPDGEKLVALYDTVGEFCQFNSTTGQITPLFLFKPTNVPETSFETASAEFSLDSKYLYISSNFSEVPAYAKLNQYDATTTDSTSFIQSEIFIKTIRDFSGINRGPDGKIYCTVPLKDSLSVIHNPSIQGTGCNFEHNVIWLNEKIVYYGFPQFLQRYYLYLTARGECVEDSVEFSFVIWPPADSVYWNFGDPSSGINNNSHLFTPSHKFTSTGDFTVTLIARHNDNRFDTAVQNIHIFPSPTPDLGLDLTICSGDSITYDAGSCSGCTFKWDNLLTGQFNIGNEQMFTAHDSGLYAVTVTSSRGCIGSDTARLTIVDEVSATVDPATLAICTGDTAQLSLSCNIPPCDFTWTAVASSPLVSGYSDGTGALIDQILFNADTIDQTVTYTILPSSPSCSGIPLDYPVTVHPSPQTWADPPELTICSGQEAVLSLSSNLDGTTFSWSAYGSSGDVTGFSDGTGPIISQVLQNTGEEAGTVTYLVTPVSGVGCTGLVDSVIVTILPVVEATITPPSMTLCSGDTTAILLFCNLSGCDFSWTAAASSPLVSGFSGGTGDTIRQILFNDDTVDQHVTYSIVPSISGCGSDTTEYPVVIHPLLPVSVTISASLNPVCAGIPVTFIAFPVNGGSSPTYQWKVNASNAGMNNAVFTYVPASGDQVSVILTSSETCTSNNPATSNTIEMNVVEAPDVSLAACFDTITTTHAKPILLRGGIPLGGTYSGTGVTSSTGGTSGTSWSFDPAVAGVGVHEITYRYTNYAGCLDSANLSIINYQLSIINCGDSLTDIRDNKKYPTVQIGSQCWMAAGLDYGTTISASSPQRDNCIAEKYMPPSSFVPRPSFYQWDELMQYQETENLQGLCPPEWHVPSETDWEILFANWTNNAFAGKPLLYTGFSGFNALLTGVQFFNRLWEFEDSATFLWSSTAHGPHKAWAHAMNEYNYSVSYYPSYRLNAFSVRCVRD